ncbi:MAG TPA: sialate O-acetylesterase [Sedimentisphaerales bacterium]|nr:sialate O-acetylesterase [Sedimentisphaerales bacterium]
MNVKNWAIIQETGIIIAVFVGCSFGSIASADVKPADILGDHMVLQCGMAVPVWGTAEPGEEVTVTFDGQSKKTKADFSGRWMTMLDPLKVGKPRAMTIAGKNTITFNDVLVGEVWVCSGQSNMAMKMSAVNNAQEEIAAADYARIRLNGTSGWQPCSPETVRGFSSTAYFFGRHLYENLGVPVGLINRSVGGTPIEEWTPREAVLATEYGKKMYEGPNSEPMKSEYVKYLKRVEEAKERIRQWKEAQKQGKAQGRTPKLPKFRGGLTDAQIGSLYREKIQPVIPYAIRGVIWYQGERNARFPNGALAYRQLLPAMIGAWRKAWGQGGFPFLYVQLPNWEGGKDWPVIRESMLKSLSTPNTGMAVTIDIGKSLHPKNKQDVGKRLGLLARDIAYGQEIVSSGPLYKSVKIDGSKIVLSFVSIGGGLVAKDGELKSFEIAGRDCNFVEASAKIEGDKVVVESGRVAKPVAVRYGWARDPECYLYNKEGLPASPFRTDSWDVPSEH